MKKFPIDEIPHPPAKETYRVFLEWFSNKKYTTYTNEIETQHRVIKRYFFHQKFVNPCIKCLSHVFGDKPVKYVKERTFNEIGTVNKAIDIACGDDKTRPKQREFFRKNKT